MTNRELFPKEIKIDTRYMSNEELAEIISEDCSTCPLLEKECQENGQSCKDSVFEWLESEVEDK